MTPQALLERFAFIVAYEPLRTEVLLGEILSLPANAYVIPPRAALDPIEEARKTVAASGGRSTCVLIPGRRFDTTGTRHGQGGGWYDRFLAAVPKAWIRVGFCFDDQLSSVPLPRMSWDQAMDYLIVVGRKDGSVSLHETRARS